MRGSSGRHTRDAHFTSLVATRSSSLVAHKLISSSASLRFPPIAVHRLGTRRDEKSDNRSTSRDRPPSPSSSSSRLPIESRLVTRDSIPQPPPGWRAPSTTDATPPPPRDRDRDRDRDRGRDVSSSSSVRTRDLSSSNAVDMVATTLPPAPPSAGEGLGPHTADLPISVDSERTIQVDERSFES